MAKKVFILYGNSDYNRMYMKYGWEVVSSKEDADLVQFTGGEDVSPQMYGEEEHPYTNCNRSRDEIELEVARWCLDEDIPMVGICRGGQFLNVFNGGKLYQHVDGHGISGTHPIVDLDTGDEIQVTSTHHQMMRPARDGEVLALAWKATKLEHMEGNTVVIEDASSNDTEVVIYPVTRCLCFQPHPEFVVHSEQVKGCADYFFKLVETYLEV